MCVCISLFGNPIIACWPRLVDGVQVEKGRSVTWAVSLITREWLVWRPKIGCFIPRIALSPHSTAVLPWPPGECLLLKTTAVLGRFEIKLQLDDLLKKPSEPRGKGVSQLKCCSQYLKGKNVCRKVDHSRDCLSVTNPTKCLMVRLMEHTIPSLGLKY